MAQRKLSLKRCNSCRQVFIKSYYHKPENCPGPPEETTKMDKALKGWKKGRKGNK